MGAQCCGVEDQTTHQQLPSAFAGGHHMHDRDTAKTTQDTINKDNIVKIHPFAIPNYYQTQLEQLGIFEPLSDELQTSLTQYSQTLSISNLICLVLKWHDYLLIIELKDEITHHKVNSKNKDKPNNNNDSKKEDGHIMKQLLKHNRYQTKHNKEHKTSTNTILVGKYKKLESSLVYKINNVDKLPSNINLNQFGSCYSLILTILIQRSALEMSSLLKKQFKLHEINLTKSNRTLKQTYEEDGSFSEQHDESSSLLGSKSEDELFCDWLKISMNASYKALLRGQKKDIIKNMANGTNDNGNSKDINDFDREMEKILRYEIELKTLRLVNNLVGHKVAN